MSLRLFGLLGISTSPSIRFVSKRSFPYFLSCAIFILLLSYSVRSSSVCTFYRSDYLDALSGVLVKILNCVINLPRVLEMTAADYFDCVVCSRGKFFRIATSSNSALAPQGDFAILYITRLC